MKYQVDDTCIGCGFCAAACPEIFEMTGDGLARTKDTAVSDQERAAAEEAMEGCPVGAISETW